MEVIVKEGVVIIESDCVVIELIMKDSAQKITDVMTINVKANDIVSEVQYELDMKLSTIVSGEFGTDAFYGIANNGEKVFISRNKVRFNPKIFNLVDKTVQLPFYAIINRYSVNSVTKERYQFARVFATQEEMMKVYRNTVMYLKLNKLNK